MYAGPAAAAIKSAAPTLVMVGMLQPPRTVRVARSYREITLYLALIAPIVSRGSMSTLTLGHPGRVKVGEPLNCRLHAPNAFTLEVVARFLRGASSGSISSGLGPDVVRGGPPSTIGSPTRQPVQAAQLLVVLLIVVVDPVTEHPLRTSGHVVVDETQELLVYITLCQYCNGQDMESVASETQNVKEKGAHSGLGTRYCAVRDGRRGARRRRGVIVVVVIGWPVSHRVFCAAANRNTENLDTRKVNLWQPWELE